MIKLINNVAKAHGVYFVFAGVVERTREGNELYQKMVGSGFIKINGSKKQIKKSSSVRIDE